MGIDLRIKKVKRGWIVFRDDRHSHFETLKRCQQCEQFIMSGILPHNRYYQIAIARLLSADEFETLRPEKLKQRYVNRKCV
jgi:hypothetical protein